MIVFTLINNETDDVWVGTARDGVSPEARFKQLQDALELGIDHPFYKDLRAFGAEAFSVDIYAVADDRSELALLVEEALETHNGNSLVGIKTVASSTALGQLTGKSQSSRRAGAAKTTSAAGASGTAKKVSKEKLSAGRTGSAAKERKIKEAIEAEKAAIAAAKAKRVAEEAAEMKAIMAALDARGSTLSRR
ncbi:hypothetical protein Maes01_02635 [Microbulbifer aestuariivivens]|uniref:GIY-YIG nuclease family protein n=1 Tax=Microbulbifer aestuariivivens TaxID=1908308 RepID=A0ABP9WVJ3_9GAMM